MCNVVVVTHQHGALSASAQQMTRLSLQPQQASGVEHIISCQVAAAQLAVPREGFPPMQHTPVIDEQRLQGKKKGQQSRVSTAPTQEPLM